jgi:hypothetical protein
MSPEARACLASVKVVTRQAAVGDGAAVAVTDVKLWGKIRALELLATYFGLLKNQVEHSGEVDLVQRLRAARLRGRAASAGVRRKIRFAPCGLRTGCSSDTITADDAAGHW